MQLVQVEIFIVDNRYLELSSLQMPETDNLIEKVDLDTTERFQLVQFLNARSELEGVEINGEWGSERLNYQASG